MATQAYAYNPDPSPYAPPANAPPEGTYAVPMTQYPPQQQYPPGTVIPQQQYPPGTVIYAAAPAPVVMNPVTGPDPSNIPDYMATSVWLDTQIYLTCSQVINLLCCCFILGLLALLKSNEVQQAKARRGLFCVFVSN